MAFKQFVERFYPVIFALAACAACWIWATHICGQIDFTYFNGLLLR
jgi:hypothetical protein